MNKKIVISLISLVIAGALVFVFIVPLWSSVKTLQREIGVKKQEVSKVEELLAKTRQLQKEYQEVEKEAAKIFLALPEEEDIPHLLVQFEALAASNGLLLESIRFNQPVQEKERISQGFPQSNLQKSSQSKKTLSTFPSLSVNVTVSGTYDAFKGYLAGLENNVRSIDVHSIQFATRQGEKEAKLSASWGIFEFNLGASVYYQ
jgi:Tfp pilus assembly protein PilO